MTIYRPFRFELRRGTAAVWTATNPILLAGEPGVESDTAKLKVGDGVSVWAALPYVSSAAHSPAEHTDRTQSIWIPATVFAGDSGSQATAGVVPDAVRVVTLADAATQGALTTAQVPADAVAGSPLTATIYWRPSTTLASSAAVFSLDALKLNAAGDDFDATGTTVQFTGTAANKTTRLMVIEAETQILASVSARDLIRLDCRRLGADAADTYTGVVGLVGIELRYTADQ